MDRQHRSRTRSAQLTLASLGLAALTATTLGTTGTAAAAEPVDAAPTTVSALARSAAAKAGLADAPAQAATGFSSPRAVTGATPAPPRAVIGQTLPRGGALGPGDSLASPSGRFSLLMEADGTLVLREAPNRFAAAPYDTVLGAGAAGSRLVLQGDGNLVLYGTDNTVYSDTETAGSDAQLLAVNDDGNVVLYGTGRTVVYEFETDDPSTLYPGGTLLPGERLTSEDGGTTLAMQTDGNLVLTTQGAVRFATSTSSPGAALVFQGDGNVVLYSETLQPLFTTRTRGDADSALELDVLDREFGVFAVTEAITALYGSAWTTPVVESGMILLPGDRRTAAGGVLLVLQEDGNLVEYVNGRAVFSTRTNADLAYMQPDGNFVLYRFDGDSDISPVFSTRTGRFSGSRLVVQSDRNVVVYTPDNRAVYATRR